ncbi:hypothetical protein V8C86DRAFT_2676909 [Haematococcus lacustris]
MQRTAQHVPFLMHRAACLLQLRSASTDVAAATAQQEQHPRLQVHDLCDGEVKELTKLLAIVQLDKGGLGRLHVSQFSKQRVENMTSPPVFRIGEKIKAVVLSLKPGQMPLLSTKVLEAVPGQMLTDRQEVFAKAAQRMPQFVAEKNALRAKRVAANQQLQVGQVVTGVVVLVGDHMARILVGEATVTLRSQWNTRGLRVGEERKVLVTGLSLEGRLVTGTVHFTEGRTPGTFVPIQRSAPGSTDAAAAATGSAQLDASASTPSLAPASALPQAPASLNTRMVVTAAG